MSKKIKNSQQLQQRLVELQIRRDQLESSIVQNSSEAYTVFTHPGPIIKKTVHELALDREFRSDLWTIVLSSVANYAGKKFADSSFARGLVDGIGKAFFKEKTEHTNQSQSSEQTTHNTGESASADLFNKLLDVIRDHRKS